MNRHQTSRFLHKYGQTVLIRRPSSIGQFPEVSVPARVDRFQPHELTGNVLQGDRNVIVAPSDLEEAGWVGGILVGDEIVINGVTTTVEGRETKEMRDGDYRFNVQVRGG